MKIYSKIVGRIRNNKPKIENGSECVERIPLNFKIKRVIGIASLAIGYKFGKMNSIPDNLPVDSNQQAEQVEDSFEKKVKLATTSDEVKEEFSQKFSNSLIVTGSGSVIGARTLVPLSEALKYTLEIRSGGIEGVDALPVDGFGVNPPLQHRPSSSRSIDGSTFGTETSLENDSPDSDSDSDTCNSPYSSYSSESFEELLLSETLDNVDSSSVSSSNTNSLSEVLPEVLLDYEVSDSDEIYDDEFNDEHIYPNSLSPGYKSAKKDDYTESVYEYKYSTSPNRLDRFQRREMYANKKENELFSHDRTQEDLTKASKIDITDKQLKNKIWRHPEFFGLTKSKSSSRTPKQDFFKQHGDDAKTELKEHLISPNTRCFKNGFYREHEQLYDYYYNNQTGKLVLVKNNVETGEQEIFSFWTISKMQRLELLNHNHVHKHWKLVEALRKQNIEERALVEAQNERNREQARLNEVVSPIEAARRASESIKKKSETNNDIK